MSTINLKLEQIKDEDFIVDEEETLEKYTDTNTNITECGRIFLDLEMKTLSFFCFYCQTAFQEVSDLFEHVTDTHIIMTPEVTDELYEIESSINCNTLEITACPEIAETSNDETDSICLKSIIQSSEHLDDDDDVIQTNESSFKCDKCPKAFRTKEILYYHSAVHRIGSETNFKCSHCDQTFAKKRYLQMHLNYHLDEKSFPCTICGKQNRTAHQLKIHMKKHSSKKECVCEICGSSYRLRHHLVTHQRQTHENKREFKCNECDRAFNTLTFLNSHKLSHSKERKHICNICGSGFVWRKNLIEHTKLHSGVKRHKCHICKKAFFQKSGLITHIKSHTCTIEN